MSAGRRCNESVYLPHDARSGRRSGGVSTIVSQRHWCDGEGCGNN